MKKTITLFVLMACAFTAQAQFLDGNFKQFSLEAGYGMSMPLSKIHSPLSSGNYTSETHFDMGLRYMIDLDWGVKGQLAFDNFDGSSSDFGVRSFRLDAQAHYNLGRASGLLYSTDETVGLYLHSGFGLTFNNSKYSYPAGIFQYAKGTEHTGNFIVGLTPMLKLSDLVALSVDLSYVLNFKQHYSYDGVRFEPITADNHHATSHLGFGIGLVFYPGSLTEHADWYH